VFFAAGLGALYQAINRLGERERWAHELGLQFDRRTIGGKVRWTDEAIESALTPLLKSRTTWPTKRDFTEASLGNLYQAIRKTDAGLAGWARRHRVQRVRA
jgi:hypothetical protein